MGIQCQSIRLILPANAQRPFCAAYGGVFADWRGRLPEQRYTNGSKFAFAQDSFDFGAFVYRWFGRDASAGPRRAGLQYNMGG